MITTTGCDHPNCPPRMTRAGFFYIPRGYRSLLAGCRPASSRRPAAAAATPAPPQRAAVPPAPVPSPALAVPPRAASPPPPAPPRTCRSSATPAFSRLPLLGRAGLLAFSRMPRLGRAGLLASSRIPLLGRAVLASSRLSLSGRAGLLASSRMPRLGRASLLDASRARSSRALLPPRGQPHRRLSSALFSRAAASQPERALLACSSCLLAAGLLAFSRARFLALQPPRTPGLLTASQARSSRALRPPRVRPPRSLLSALLS